LIQSLKDECSSVRETSAGILGKIGLPEAMNGLNELIAVAKKPSEDPNVKSLAIWAIGRLGPDAYHRARKVLVAQLTNSYWKVRTTACMTISAMGYNIASLALPVLTKVNPY
jgi:HEAT repeat protein